MVLPVVATKRPTLCLLATVHMYEMLSVRICGLQHAYLREALCADGWPREKHMRTPIEGSALLNLRELKVLKANWWNIYFEPAAASSSKSRPIELVLPELSTTARSELLHADHQSLLHAALRGGA